MVFLIVLLLIFPTTYSFPQEKNISDISEFSTDPSKLYTNKEGLPQSNVITTAIDKLGKLWIGTQDGAAVYNSYRWEIINMPQISKSNYIQSIKVFSDSSIWFGVLRGGVARLYNGKFDFYTVSDGLPTNYIISIAEEISEDKKSIVWVGTNNGVARKDKGKWEIISTENEKELAGDLIYDIFQSNVGTVWFATNKGVSKYKNGKFSKLEMPKQIYNKQIFKIFQSSDGSLWFGSSGLVGRYDGGNWQFFNLGFDENKNRITSILESRDGTIWIGSLNGAWKLSRLKGNTYSEPSKIKFNLLTKNIDDFIVWSISETLDGSIWFGTFLGLIKYNYGKWKGLTEKMGLEQGGTTSIIQTKNGEYYFGTDAGLIHFKEGKFDHVKNISGSILYLFEDKEGNLWISVFLEGVYCYKNKMWYKYQIKNGLSSNTNWFISQTSDGAMWFGSDLGVTKYLNNKWYRFNTKDGLSDNTVLCLRESFDSTLYFGTTKGVSIYKNNKWDKLEAKNFSLDLAVSDIFEYTDSNLGRKGLWIATLGGGVLFYDYKSNEITVYNTLTSPSISNNSVYKIKKDSFGRLYFLTNHGVTRFTFVHKDSIRSEIFTNEDGLPNNEGISSASFLDSEGRIWFGTTEGAALFDPRNEMVDTLKKQILLEKIIIKDFYDNNFIKNGIELSYYQNTIFFEFALLSFFKENENKYSYQLVGYDNNRSEWTSDFKKEYSNLPDGKYNFVLWGKDFNGNISGPIEFSFVILPPWWETWWFQTLMLLLVGGSIFLAIKIYTAQKIKKHLMELERKNLIERERTRISQDMHDLIGSDLTKIAILSDRIENELRTFDKDSKLDGIKNRIISIGEISREIIDEMNEIIWSLSTKYDSLNDLVYYIHHYANEILEHHSTTLEFNLPERIPEIILPPEVRRNIFLIFKEAINNLIKYSKATIVKIMIGISDFNFYFEISDNGVGFLELQYDNLQDRVPKFGIRNMKHRAKAIGAILEIKSSIGKGTVVKLIFSLKSIK